jgi:hypothetical protein
LRYTKPRGTESHWTSFKRTRRPQFRAARERTCIRTNRVEPERLGGRRLTDKDVEIAVEPYQKIVIHEVVEHRLNDFLDLILIHAQAAGGTTVPLVQWAGGVLFQIQPFNPDSEVVIEEQLKGILHYASVAYAVKDRFEPELRTSRGTIRLVDSSSSSILSTFAKFLRGSSKLQS